MSSPHKIMTWTKIAADTYSAPVSFSQATATGSNGKKSSAPKASGKRKTKSR